MSEVQIAPVRPPLQLQGVQRVESRPPKKNQPQYEHEQPDEEEDRHHDHEPRPEAHPPPADSTDPASAAPASESAPWPGEKPKGTLIDVEM